MQWEEVELTQEKKDFLTAMSMDEERVQAGKRMIGR